MKKEIEGIEIVKIFEKKGWLGRVMEKIGIKVEYEKIGIMIEMFLKRIKFVVRKVKKVIEEMREDVEEDERRIGDN